MVELAHLTGDRQNDLKNEKVKAKMGAARAVLEKSTMMLLTSCKTCLRHPDCQPARDTRNGVFSSMRRALVMIDDVIYDGYEPKPRGVTAQNGISSSRNLHAVLQELADLVQTARVTQADANTRRRMSATLDMIIDSTQDFTDSAYTSHEHRERILNLNTRAKKELKMLADVGISIDGGDTEATEDQLGVCVLQLSQTICDLRKQLQTTALAQCNEIFRTINDASLLASMKNAAASGNLDRLEEKTNDFSEHTEQLQETCRILGHVATLAPLAISADYAENNLRTLAPQIIASALTVAINPSSKIAKESVDVFIDTWESQMNELSVLVKEISDVLRGKNVEKQVYLSLPRPGKHGSSPKLVKPAKLDAEEQAKIAKLGLEMKLMTSELDAETDKWEEPDNDIVKRAKNMSSMAYSMYLFTRGEGLLKTTQDLFKQAEYFAEEGNKLYRSVKEFALQVPDCPMLSDLVAHLEQIPTYCQQLNFTTKSPASGKVATFNKVDCTILETKNLMSAIGKLVPLCYSLALKYQIVTPDSPISKWRTAPPPMMDLRSNGDDLDSVGSYESSRSSGSLLMSSSVQKPMQNLNAFERITIE
ncbi:LOW QUALITY PROTEIN: alpha-catulin-like [Amphiura filiformis]|uniref:LOW QUALITY PROTEIN: alpha-catulin-like n=1 Tax=Amphiura filiformis TaxID=82378 RepID=UPI003B2268A1